MFIVPITPMQITAEIQKTNAVQQVNETASGASFSNLFQSAIDQLKEAEAVTQQDAKDLAMGNADDLHTIMINSTKYATALELTVQLASKAVNAYNEIMRMQI